MSTIEQPGTVEAGDPDWESTFSELGIDPDAPATSPESSDPVPVSQSSPGERPDAGAAPPAGDDRSRTTSATTDPSTSSPSEDPLAGTEPFSLDLNGEQKTFDGVYRVPGQGLLIPDETGGAFRKIAEEHAALDRSSRELQTRIGDYDRLSAWQTVNEKGEPQTVEGAAGIAAMRVENAQLRSVAQLLVDVLDAPDRLMQLGLVTDAAGNVVLSEAGKRALLADLKNVRYEAKEQAGNQLRQLLQPPQPSAVNGIDAQTAQLGVQSLIQQHQWQLAPADQAFLTQQYPRYVRPASANDVRLNPQLKVGQSVLDHEFVALAQRVAQKPAAQVQQQKQQAAFNGGQQKGRTPAKPSSPAPRAGSQPPAPSTTSRPQADWDGPFQRGLQSLMAEGIIDG